MNAPLLFIPGGSRALAILVLLFIMAINGLIVPATSIKKSRLLFNVKISEYCAPVPLAVTVAFSCLLAICTVRGLGVFYTFSNTIANAGIFVFAVIAITVSLIQAETTENRNQILNAVFFSAPLYVAINLILFVLGLAGNRENTGLDSEAGVNQTLQLIGITTKRIVFPLAPGVNGFGAIAAFSLLICAFYGAYAKGLLKYGALIFAPLVLVALALTDARGATLAAIAAGIGALWLKKHPGWIRGAYSVLLITPLIPSLAYRFFDFANQSSLFSFATREGDIGARLGVGTGRGEIWKSILGLFSNFEPIQLVGYGPFGQAISGVSSQYAWIFNELGASLMSCHSAYLQYLIDMGYIGVIAWLGMLATIIYNTSKMLNSANEKNSTKLIATSLLLLTLIQSQTETIGTIYTPEMLIFLLVITVASSFHAQGQAVIDKSSILEKTKTYKPHRRLYNS
ncbi:MAG: O-antigen ligase family protein [Burkholderiales bacterium]|nr:O-antigen ligase family protein [Burkholderiales bacterium]